MARNPELDHEFREYVPEKKPGTAGFVYIDENHSRCTTNGFNPLEGPQMASLTTLGDSQRKGWKRILIYTLALAAILAVVYVILRLIGYDYIVI